MPGRVARGASTRTSRKTDVPANNASRASVEIPEEGPVTGLRTSICTVFADALKSTAGHRKSVVSLRKIQEACCYEPIKAGKKGLDGFEEEDFNAEVARCVLRIMGIKKSESAGDRLIRFLGLFLRHASDKDAALIPEAELEMADAFPETPSSRLVSHILSVTVPLLQTKEKVVRYRATQIISHIVNALDSIDDEYYHLVRASLLKRIRDKEAMVRVQAVLGLARLAGNEGGQEEEDADSDDDASGLLEKLLEVLQNDPSADVRRSLLLNLPLAPATLPFILERARDMDPATRRALYSRLLPVLGDFRHLSLSMREKLLRWGLRDRDEHVRKAMARLFRERWIEDCAGTRNENGQASVEQAAPSIDALLELLERIDVVNAGHESGIALEALKEFWDGRPDYRDAVSFEDPFWDNLSAESIFMARSFNDFCRQDNGKYEAVLEEKMPEVTKLAFMIQRYTNALMEKLRTAQSEEETVEQEFIVEQLLHIAETLDYTDEIGRRKMFALLRESLATPDLPEEITKLVIEVLRRVCGDEREFCGIGLEAIAEVHDTIAEEEHTDTASQADDSFHSARSEVSSDTTPTKPKAKKLLNEDSEIDDQKAIQEIVVNMKCLHIAQCMLQNVGSNLQDNAALVTMLNTLVVPAVRSHEAPIRERGLLCLGLCCLLDATLAGENFSLFLHCFAKGHTTLQTTALEILADMISTHPSLLTNGPEASALAKQTTKTFLRALKLAHEPSVQAAAVTALAKLLLTSTLPHDSDLLTHLVLTFFDPATRANPAVRQALSYFLPAFAYSCAAHMARLGAVVPTVLARFVALQDEWVEGEGDDMLGLGTVGAMLVDWTDARKLVGWDKGLDLSEEARGPNTDVHLDLALACLERALGPGCAKEERKALLAPLGKLHISSNADAEMLQKATELLEEAVESKVAAEASTRNALVKLQTMVLKAVGEVEGREKEESGEKSSKVSRKSTVRPASTASMRESDDERTIRGDDDVTMLDVDGRSEIGESLLGDED